MDKFFKIAAILTATDKMSSVFASASSKSVAEMDKIQNQMKAMGNASFLIGAGRQGLGFVTQFVDASADMEEAGNRLKAVMLGADGTFNNETFKKVQEQSQKLSNVYAQSAMDYVDATRIFKQNRIEPTEVLGGLLESTAKLADYFDQMNPGQVALFASRMRNDFGVSANEMGSMMDLLARLKDSGIGGFSGPAAVEQMTQFFGKASLGMANMKTMGLQAAKELGTVGGYFISRGLSPETVGTNVRRIYDTLRNPDRLGQMMNSARSLAGVQFKFFDNDKKFLGMANFVQELSKLKGLDVQTIDAILSKPFGGKMGLSSEMVTFLAQHGTEKYQEFSKSLDNQATLSQKLAKMMDGLNYIVKVIKSSFETMKQIFATGLLPLLKNLGTWLNNLIVRLQQFAMEHPRIIKMFLLLASFASLALIFRGVQMSIMLLGNGLRLLGIQAAFAMGPIGWLIAGAGLLAAALISFDVDPVIGDMNNMNTSFSNVNSSVDAFSKKMNALDSNKKDWAQSIGLVLDKAWFGLTGVKGGFMQRDENEKSLAASLVTGNGTGQFIFTNHITVNGASHDVATQVSKAVSDTQRDFARQMKEYDAQQSRKKY